MQGIDHEARACLNMFTAAFCMAVEDNRKMVAAALAGKKSTTLGDSQRRAVGSVDHEIARARENFERGDARFFAEMAGIDVRIERLMDYIAAGRKMRPHAPRAA